MARCVVLGGGGFIGSHLIDRLVNDGHEVTCFDRPSERAPSFVSKNVNMIYGDFMNQSDIENALEKQEIVFHLVSTTTPATAEEDPVFDVRTNISASVELFEKCVKNDIKKIIFASTGGAIYGDQEKTTFNEDDQTFPVSPYAIGKLTIENYLRYFKKKHNLNYTVFRISNPYGTRQNPIKKQGVIPIFLRNIALGKPITILGDGSMVRDYIFVEDVVRMMSVVVNKECKQDTYNIGSGEGESVADLADLIEKVVDKDIQRIYVDKPKTFVDHVTLDTNRYKDEFCVEPTTTLEDGIRKTWEEISRQA